MRLKKVKLSFILLLSLCFTGLQAQETITTTGSNASGSGGSVSCTIGQITYTQNNGINGSVAQGVQQPYEISVGLKEADCISLQCLAYPNPTTDEIQLKVEGEKLKDLSYQLFDMNGKLLENKKVDGNETNIAMTNFVKATYFLKVFQGGKEIITFKIIKN